MGSLRKVTLPKTQLRIKKPKESEDDDNHCRKWWMKTLDLASGLVGGDWRGGVASNPHLVKIEVVNDGMDNFPEEVLCRLLDIFQSLEYGEEESGRIKVEVEGGGINFSYHMEKCCLYEPDDTHFVENHFVEKVKIYFQKVQLREIDGYLIPSGRSSIVNVHASWMYLDFHRIFFAELFEHMGIELED